MTESELKKIITGYDDVRLDDSSSDEWVVYSINGQIMAALSRDKTPVRLALRCDRNLAWQLKDKYESVVNPSRLSKNNFIQLLLVGQLSDGEVKDLIRLAFEMTRAIIK